MQSSQSSETSQVNTAYHYNTWHGYNEASDAETHSYVIYEMYLQLIFFLPSQQLLPFFAIEIFVSAYKMVELSFAV